MTDGSSIDSKNIIAMIQQRQLPGTTDKFIFNIKRIQKGVWTHEPAYFCKVNKIIKKSYAFIDKNQYKAITRC